MIHDQVAIGSPMRTTPNCASSATTNSTREITHTTKVGALPEKLLMMDSLLFELKQFDCGCGSLLVFDEGAASDTFTARAATRICSAS